MLSQLRDESLQKSIAYKIKRRKLKRFKLCEKRRKNYLLNEQRKDNIQRKREEIDKWCDDEARKLEEEKRVTKQV